jgi:dihydroxyacetone kinase-like predicted kinase
LLEARGNSGTILAEALRGLCQTWAPLGTVGPAELVRGFQAAAERADRAVLEPVEGTILTVVRATVRALEALPADDVGRQLAAAADAAAQAVAATRNQLAALRRAGVVDAGARGWELCLRAFAASTGGVPPRSEPADVPAPGCAVLTPGYEVQYLLTCSQQDAQAIEGYLRTIGESVTLVRGDGCVRVHVHTDRPGPAIEAALRVGKPSRIEIACLHPQVHRSGTAFEDHPSRA